MDPIFGGDSWRWCKRYHWCPDQIPKDPLCWLLVPVPNISSTWLLRSGPCDLFQGVALGDLKLPHQQGELEDNERYAPSWPLAKNIKSHLLYFNGDELWDIINSPDHPQNQAEAENLPDTAPLFSLSPTQSCFPIPFLGAPPKEIIGSWTSSQGLFPEIPTKKKSLTQLSSSWT